MGALLFYEGDHGSAWLNGDTLTPDIPVWIGKTLTCTLAGNTVPECVVVSDGLDRQYSVQLKEQGVYLLTSRGGSLLRPSDSPVKAALDSFGLGRKLARAASKHPWEIRTCKNYPERPVAPKYKWFDTDGTITNVRKSITQSVVVIEGFSYVIQYMCAKGFAPRPTSIVYWNDDEKTARSIIESLNRLQAENGGLYVSARQEEEK